MQWVLSLPGGGGSPWHDKIQIKTLFEETGPQGWSLACPGQAVGSAEGEQSPSRDSILTPALYCCCPCGICWFCYRMGMATSGHIWVVDALMQRAGCAHACPACSSPLLLSPFPPWFTPEPMGTRKQGREGFHWGGHFAFLWGREPARGITWVGDKGLPIYPQFLLSSYCDVFSTARPCLSSAKNTTPVDNVQDLTLCAKESLTHLQLQGCQLTPPYLPPRL